jgi:hypothetical protein
LGDTSQIPFSGVRTQSVKVKSVEVKSEGQVRGSRVKVET